jgi:raffinose/stachyose/melibiose transport system permease protein
MNTTQTTVPAVRPAGTRRSQGAAKTSRATPSIWYVVPALVMFIGFAVLPLGAVAVLSFTDWDGLSDIGFIGFDNWSQALTEPQTWQSLGLTLQVMILSWVVQTPISLLLGVFTAGKQKYRSIYGVLFFIPLLISAAAIAIAYKALLDPNFGLGQSTGIPFLSQNWLGNPDIVIYVLVFIIAWQFVPFHALLYQGGVRQIPDSLYEAATIDGAGRMAQFFSITLPQLRNTMITSSTLMLVGSLTYFDIVFVLTQGGPGTSTRLLPLDMYLTGFSSYNMGLASVLAVILVVLGLTLSLGLTKFSGFSKMSSDLEGA